MKRIIYCFLFILFFPFVLKGQTEALKVCFSKNNQVVAFLNYEKITSDSLLYKIDIYKTTDASWLNSLDIYEEMTLEIDNFEISNDGKLISILYRRVDKNNPISGKDNEVSYVCRVANIINGELVYSAVTDKKHYIVGFPNITSFFSVATENEFQLFDAYSGDLLKTYRKPMGANLLNIVFSPNDKFAAAISDRDKILIWDCDNGDMVQLNGSDLYFTADNDYLMVTKNSTSGVTSQTYKLPTLTRIVNTSSGRVIREAIKQEKDYNKIMFPGSRLTVLPYNIDIEKSGISNDGKFSLYYANRDTGRVYCFFVDMISGYSTAVIEGDYLENPLFPYTWATNSAFIAQNVDSGASIYSLASMRYVQDMNFLFSYSAGERAVSLRKQVDERIVSPTMRHVLIPSGLRRLGGFYIRSTTTEQKKTLVQNCDFVQFSPSGQYILVKNSSNKYGIVRTYDVDTDMGEAPIEPYWFGESGDRRILQETVLDETEAPEDYVYHRFNNIRSISEASEDDLIKLNFKTIQFGDSITTLQIHLLDKEGNFYAGAGTEEWKNIWCNLLLQSDNGNISQVNDFTVTEYSKNDSLPSAIAIVLDHSGSMGDERAYALQNAAEMFIKQKNENDAIALIKYDHKTNVEAKLSTNTSKLLQQLRTNGLGGFGGGTALLDGVMTGVSALQQAKGYGRKVLIILTDGNENSSVASKGETLFGAHSNDVSIFTIGYGDFVSEDYLKGIAYMTEGSYYQIYSQENFNWIFEDIFNKIRNYYSITFDTRKQGDYNAFLEICLENKVIDSMAVAFNTFPIDYDNIFDLSNFEITAPISNYVNPATIRLFSQFSPLIDFSKIIIGSPSYVAVDTSRIIDYEEVEADFSKLQLPNVKFETNTTNIVAGTEAGIMELVEFLKQNPAVNIEINGHTDNVGSDTDNVNLSLQRAQKVKELLLQQGIATSRIITNGFGEAEPIADNETEEGRAKNRRVEIKLL